MLDRSCSSSPFKTWFFSVGSTSFLTITMVIFRSPDAAGLMVTELLAIISTQVNYSLDFPLMESTLQGLRDQSRPDGEYSRARRSILV